MKRGILLIALVAALMSLTATAWADAPNFKGAAEADQLLQKAAKCPGGDCGNDCRLKRWLNANVAREKAFARSSCNGYLDDDTLLRKCKEWVAKVPEKYTCKAEENWVQKYKNHPQSHPRFRSLLDKVDRSMRGVIEGNCGTLHGDDDALYELCMKAVIQATSQ